MNEPLTAHEALLHSRVIDGLFLRRIVVDISLADFKLALTSFTDIFAVRLRVQLNMAVRTFHIIVLVEVEIAVAKLEGQLAGLADIVAVIADIQGSLTMRTLDFTALGNERILGLPEPRPEF